MADRLQDLLARKAALEQQIIDLQREERGAAIAQIRALMTQHGLSLADLGPRTSAPAPKLRSNAPAKVAPKYRDPASGQTWSGRGLHPKWLTQALATGAKIEDFAI